MRPQQQDDAVLLLFLQVVKKRAVLFLSTIMKYNKNDPDKISTDFNEI